MKVRPTAAAGALAAILAFAEERAPGARAHLERAVLGGPLGPDLDARVPADRIPALLEEAARITGDSCFGLHHTTASDPRRFGVLAYATSTSRTLGEAFGHATRFLALWNGGMELRIATAAGEISLEFAPRALALDRDSEGLRQLLELSTATTIHLGRTFTGVNIAPRAVELYTAEPAPATLAELARFYASPLGFRAPVTRVVLDASVLDLPLRTADPTLAAIIARHAEGLLADLQTAPTWARRTRDAVIEALGRDATDLSAVARKLGAGGRSLQRRLREEGTSFQAVVEEARHELSLRYLRDPRMSMSEIAYLLGFADLSAFYRAFKRWTGGAPAEYRSKHAQPAETPPVRP
jgi:AraC-like DNA-binding protein